MFFEGPEKKVEIILRPGSPSLRKLGSAFWHSVVDSAKAAILSHIANEKCDAYLLSESSLFVFDDRLLMITCGRTTLVSAIEKVLQRVSGIDVQMILYERKNENFPHWQTTNFFDDVKVLNGHLSGRAYQFGEEDEHHIMLYHLDRTYAPQAGDCTLEILMHGISGRARELFIDGEPNKPAVHALGVNCIFRDFKHDEYFFSPRGYSVNAIRDAFYYTVHVTPEEPGTYVSFETNYLREGVTAIISRVLDIFRPDSFDVVLFKPDLAAAPTIDDYVLRTEIKQKLGCGYEVLFAHFFKPQEKSREAIDLTSRIKSVPQECR